MRLRLKAASSPGWLCLVLLLILWPLQTRAEDRVTVRGNYYRETSTRVLQPTVTFSKDLPDERLTLEAEYLLDAISSASIGQGAAVLGGDSVFTEFRHESTLRARSKLGEWGLGAFYRFSTETDYQANNFGFSGSRSLRQRTINISLSYAASLDRVFRIVNNIGERVPYGSSTIADDGQITVDEENNLLQVHYLSAGYSHVLHRHVLAGLAVEAIMARGPQDNPYRRARNGERETHPKIRNRFAPSGFLKWSVPGARMVVEPRYRYHYDDWQVSAHSFDTRVHFRVAHQVRIRARYRFYLQSESYFYRDDGFYEPSFDFRSDDPKMDDFWSHTPGLELTWEFDKIARYEGFRWLKGGFIQANFNYVFVRCKELSASCSDQDFGYGKVRSTRYGDARLGSLSFSLAF